MLVTTKYCIIGETTIEFVTVVDGDSTTLTVNVLPPERPAEMLMSAAADVVDITAATPSSIVEQPPEAIAPPLGAAEPCATAQPYKLGAAPTRKEKGVMSLVRGAYTAMFTLLGMVGAGTAYLRDNLDKLFQLDWKVYAVVGIGAVLSGIMYATKKYYKPDGLL